MPIQRVLIVDDDPLSREFLIEAVDSLGFTVDQAASAEDALESIARKMPDLVLSDLRMPGMDGSQLIEAIGRQYPELPTVLVTAHGTVEAAVDAMRHGAEDFLLKPCSPDTIEMVIDRIERTRRLEQENEYLRSELVGTEAPSIVGESEATSDLLRSASRIARSKGTVLITGESGTGKERVAQAVHELSPRNAQPFVAENCAAIPETLLESVLFGHKKGAFTGADSDRKGLLHEADGGTLFLDELGEMSLALQAKLLRVLETRKVRRVGAMLSETLDLRVVSATHRDLAGAVRRKAFRLDLYGRLAPWTINLSPLRHRPEDVPTLAARFTDRPMETSFVEALMLHPWPLNVRGLRAAIERAEVRPSGPLKLDRRVRAALDDALALVAAQAPPEELPRTETDPVGPRQPPDEEALRTALRVHQGRVAAVARDFDASRQQVYRWMKRYDLSIDEFR